jgi:CheY-like chemotaxis protein
MNSKYTIVLAEDSPADIFLVRRALAHGGLDYQLHVVEDAGSTASLLSRMGRDFPFPDILLIDLNLPKTDGTDLIKMFREHPDCSRTPVIVVTSSDSPKDRSRTAEIGIRGYFRKPSDLAEFMLLGTLVRDILEEGSREPQLQ